MTFILYLKAESYCYCCFLCVTLVPLYVSQGVQVVWQWFENIHGKWCTYSPENSQEMERAYQEGESSAK